MWLPDWATERLSRARAAPPVETAFALVAAGQGGVRVAASSRAAAAQGVTPGLLLADARALCPPLVTLTHDPPGDTAELEKLARWASRWSPWIACATEGNGAGGLLMDAQGCAHLFGGEAAFVSDIAARLRALGLTAHIAMASSIGAAHALAHFGAASPILIPAGAEEEAIGPLPVAALRLPEETVAALRRAGLKRIADLHPLPPCDLTRRFGPLVVMRLAQAKGGEAEPLTPILPQAAFRARRVFMEPLTAEAHIDIAIGEAAEDLCRLLAHEAKGARRIDLLLSRADGETVSLAAGLAQPSHDARHLARMLHERRARLAERFDPGFGIESLTLSAIHTEALTPRQTAFDARDEGDDIAILIDRLGARLGVRAVTRFLPRESHLPERAVVAVPAASDAARRAGDWSGHPDARPLLMLPAAERAEVLAEVPEGPPRQFLWRRVTYRVAKAEGPERIVPEWWRGAGGLSRDYYRIEDTHGRRFWLYREGLYGRETAEARWFVQGVFA